MIPAAFDYQRADSKEQAISLLKEHGDEASKPDIGLWAAPTGQTMTAPGPAPPGNK